MSTTITPHIACRNSAEAVEFYRKAFGAEVVAIHRIPDGRVMHASLNIDGATIFVVDEFPEHGGTSPEALGGSPVTIHLHVSDCDAVYQRAVDAGCQVKMPIDDMFWGDRYGCIVDPYGHNWSIATPIRQVSPEEIDQAIASFGTAGADCPK